MSSRLYLRVAPPYQLRVEVHELPDNLQLEEDEEFTFINMKLQLSGSENYRNFDITLDAMVSEEAEPILALQNELTELGVASSSHVSIIANLFEIIEPEALRFNIMVVVNIDEVPATDDTDESFVVIYEHADEWIVSRVRHHRMFIRVMSHSQASEDYYSDSEDSFMHELDTVLSASMDIDTNVKTVAADEAAIAKLEKFHQGQVDQADDHVYGCVICQEDGDEEEFTRMPCLHAFHTNCLVPWLRTNCSCPLCRFQLPCTC